MKLIRWLGGIVAAIAVAGGSHAVTRFIDNGRVTTATEEAVEARYGHEMAVRQLVKLLAECTERCEGE